MKYDLLIVAAGIKLDYDRIEGAKDALDEDCRVVSTYSPQVRDFLGSTQKYMACMLSKYIKVCNKDVNNGMETIRF